MRDYPVSIQRVQKILEENTKTSAEVIRVSNVIDDHDLQNILGRLSVINTRMGLLVSCHDIPELRDIGSLIDPAVEERFFSASEEFLHQVGDFVIRAQGSSHVQA